MPKILVGCLVVIALVVVGGGTAGYFLFLKPAWDFATDVGGFVTEYQEITERVERTEPYQPPEDGRVEPDQFQRFLVAQRDMRENMQDELEELQERWEAMQAEIDDEERDLNIREVLTAYGDLRGLLLEARRHQVSALNRYQFSLAEYAWVRNQAYRALGEQVAVAAMGEQGQPEREREIPDETRELVNSHREELMEGYALAWFGL